MRYARAERWSRVDSPIHRLHPASKIVAATAILVGISFAQDRIWIISGIYLAFLGAVTVSARIDLAEIFGAAAKVLPFALIFALVSFLSGDHRRSWILLARSYTSCYCALLLIGTTPAPSLISGLEVLRIPRFLLLVVQFLFRYTLVLFSEADGMLIASASRGGSVRNLQFQQAAAATGVLFSRAYGRSTAVYQAMIARGFDGHIRSLRRAAFTYRDVLAMAITISLVILLAVFQG